METKDVISFRRGGEVTSLGGEVTSLDLNLAGAGETKVIGVKSITYKCVNGKLYQEYVATWGVST